MYADKGYKFAEVKPEVKEVAGRPKLVNVTFNITEGPKVKIRELEFVGNKEISDGTLAGKMKENKGRGWFSFITGGRHLQGRQVRRGRREGHRLLPRPRLHRARRSASRS